VKTDEELLAEIRAELDANEKMNRNPGTCGACMSFNLKLWHDNVKPNEGRCCGWTDTNGYACGPNGFGYVSAASTCERYTENTSYLENMKKARPNTERFFLANQKRSRESEQISVIIF
jgi:hypothetical protein